MKAWEEHVSYDLEPAVGHWYRLVDKGDLFRVVGVDVDNDVIEVRWFEGDAEDLDSGSWFEMDLEQAEAPEGWTDDEDVAEEEDDVVAPKRGLRDDDDDDKLGDWEDEDDDIGKMTPSTTMTTMTTTTTTTIGTTMTMTPATADARPGATRPRD
jgi:hypothetical protein